MGIRTLSQDHPRSSAQSRLYEAEMREALELWASKLRDIIEPPPKNVVNMKKRA